MKNKKQNKKKKKRHRTEIEREREREFFFFFFVGCFTSIERKRTGEAMPNAHSVTSSARFICLTSLTANAWISTRAHMALYVCAFVLVSVCEWVCPYVLIARSVIAVLCCNECYAYDYGWVFVGWRVSAREKERGREREKERERERERERESISNDGHAPLFYFSTWNLLDLYLFICQFKMHVSWRVILMHHLCNNDINTPGLIPG